VNVHSVSALTEQDKARQGKTRENTTDQEKKRQERTGQNAAG